MNWDQILLINESDPNTSMNNLHQYINYLLDELAPYKKLSKKEYKLKFKPWINKNILPHEKRDNLINRYCKAKEIDSLHIQAIYEEYRVTRNSITKMKRESKIDYYKKYFEVNKNKASSIRKGIRSIVNIQNSSKKELFNKYFVNVGPNIMEL